MLLLFGAVIGGATVYFFMSARGPASPETPALPDGGSGRDAASADAASAAANPNARARAIEMAKALDDVYQQAERGSDLEQEPGFVALVELLAGEPFDAAQRLAWATSQTMPLSCAALAAMARSNDDRRMDVARLMGRLGYFPLYFATQYLRGSNDPEVCGLALLRINSWTADYAASREDLAAYLDQLQAAGVAPTVSEQGASLDWSLDDRREVFGQHAHPLLDAFLATLEQLDRKRRGQVEVAKVARPILAAPDGAVSHATTPAIRERLDALLEALQRPARGSLVLVGAEGVGKTALAHAALGTLVEQGWRVFEASPTQLLSGQKYIGELEQRVENFVAGLGRERAIWFVPDWHQLLEQGRASGNATGLMDRLLPYVERGDLQMLGESSVEAYSRVAARMPRVQALFTALKLEPLGDADTLELARAWAALHAQRLGREAIADAAVVEACELARQQFPQRAEPGRSMELLQDALSAASAQIPPALPIGRAQLLEALSRRSGLPLEILDSRQPLDVAAVRAFFAQRVIGQSEAVDCLVDRISMLKAGMTDPRRPVGVFLFAGPTGTGKTELAKTLADYLFGSPDRMLRVDMSEYQSEDSQYRLLGDTSQEAGDSLTARVRQNPFSVILLDEFEKAHPRIWDLFLQVFDDGRLSDRSGKTVDFRHCIIILTSNLGSTIDRGGGAGFVSARGSFSREQVDRSIEATFRREFINRLDRVVVFRPLTRALMRDILEKELRAVLGRRGFRSREWAVEWEPSAVEFLLERGFTPDLGARPLRRAIDQYLLAPLARTIVEHRVPSGEQFLFVQAEGDALDVRFVDPDAPVPAAAPLAGLAAPSDLRALALDPRAGSATLEVLAREIGARQVAVEDPAWQALKSTQALEMQRADFWQRGDRHQVLDRLERIDRIEAGVRSAAALHARLSRSGARGASDLVRRLALLVAGLERAIAAVLHDEPEDARIEIRPTDARTAQALAWRDRVAEMYARWGEARGIRMQRHGADAASGALRLDASGFGAWQALRGEAGLHVLEARMGDLDLRQSVRVSVMPVPDPGFVPATADAETRICRRYDDGPSPLVRDNVRGWRSGRLDRVLAGDFDLIGTEP